MLASTCVGSPQADGLNILLKSAITARLVIISVLRRTLPLWRLFNNWHLASFVYTTLTIGTANDQAFVYESFHCHIYGL